MKLKSLELKKEIKTYEDLVDGYVKDLTFIITNDIVSIDINSLKIKDKSGVGIGYISVGAFVQSSKNGELLYKKDGEPRGHSPIEVVINIIPNLIEKEVPFLVIRETTKYLELKSWSLCILREDADNLKIPYSVEDNPHLVFLPTSYKSMMDNSDEIKCVHKEVAGSIYEFNNFREYTKKKSVEYTTKLTKVVKTNHYDRFKLLFTYQGKRSRLLINRDEYATNIAEYPLLKNDELIKQTIADYMVGKFG